MGDVIEVSQPRNNFKLNDDADLMFFVAGGIGITLLSPWHTIAVVTLYP